eukprot:TRINITY_DN3844_c0_g2_i3.p2 TRINITY_DN3844_c0_g2~~TRINITY_DN3844_c0_g2_i3.p2  ORF type:complete len:136 (+),score=60.60 TRINITY_DN3844_c0_g2_i3:351-758(+)
MAGHPSPLSVKTFLGCRHFSTTNTFLQQQGKAPIGWQSVCSDGVTPAAASYSSSSSFSSSSFSPSASGFSFPISTKIQPTKMTKAAKQPKKATKLPTIKQKPPAKQPKQPKQAKSPKVIQQVAKKNCTPNFTCHP